MPPFRAKHAGIAAAVLATVTALVIGYEPAPGAGRYKPYRDVGGIWTVCDGHASRDVDPAKLYTDAECDALRDADIADANAMVHRCIPGPIPPGPEAAFTDAVFNIGPRIVCDSTLGRLARSGDWLGACAQLDRWNRAGGRVYRGLVRRRADERQICEAGL